MSNLAAFISQYLGKANTGDTSGNLGQCVGLIEKWLDANGMPSIPGNAVDLLANANPRCINVRRTSLPIGRSPVTLCVGMAPGAVATVIPR